MPSPSGGEPRTGHRIFDRILIHSLAWLLIANLVGLLLAILLLFPRLGDLLGPLTYGRWVPVHLDLQLYGWCSLPTVGLLLAVFMPLSGRGSALAERLARGAITVWSASLAFGALSLLAGGSSGKLFLEWGGVARVALTVALGILALILAVGFALELESGVRGNRFALFGKAILLTALATIPAILYWASSPDVYPSFNPDSGGSTGGSLLGSTLGLVAIFCLTPLLLGLRRSGSLRFVAATVAALALHFVWFLLLDHGNRSHHELLQIVSLASLLVWIPLLRGYFDAFEWPAASRSWLSALAVWGALLVVTGVVGFLPGVLEHWKFTNAFVGHAHIAMAGLLSSFNFLLLLSLAERGADATWKRDTAALLTARGAFYLWNGGLAIQVAALFALGTMEGFDAGLIIRGARSAQLLLGLRLLGGLAMVAASTLWLFRWLAREDSAAHKVDPIQSSDRHSNLRIRSEREAA